MGAGDSKLANGQHSGDGITRISEALKGQQIEPCLERLRSLKLSVPLLKASAERTLREPGVRPAVIQPPSIDLAALKLDPSTTMQLFEVYEAWQQAAAAKIGQNQEEIHNKIDAAEALAMKLLQRVNHTASAMKTSMGHLHEVHSLQENVADMKRELNLVIDNYEALCRRLDQAGLMHASSTVTSSQPVRATSPSQGLHHTSPASLSCSNEGTSLEDFTTGPVSSS